jgi:hypothetical protein
MGPVGTFAADANQSLPLLKHGNKSAKRQIVADKEVQ